MTDDATPPQSVKTRDDAGGISLAQARAVLKMRTGADVPYGRLRRVCVDLIKDERMALRPTDEWTLTAGELDMVEGELWRKRAGWTQKRNIRGDFDAWVDGADGRSRVLRLPFERTWSNALKEEVCTVPVEMACYEWPTGRQTAVLERVEDRGGLPAYIVRVMDGDG